jgi:hypothetical protein
MKEVGVEAHPQSYSHPAHFLTWSGPELEPSSPPLHPSWCSTMPSLHAHACENGEP